MTQRNLFTDIECDRCGTNPGTKPANPDLWNGFYDQDMKIYVCTHCRQKHYILKQDELKLNEGMLYSEFPVPIK